MINQSISKCKMSISILNSSKTSKKFLKSDMIIFHNFNLRRWDFCFDINWSIEITLIFWSIEKSSAQREHLLEIQMKNYELKEIKSEDKMLFRDVNSIQEPNIRAYVQAEQARILQKRVGQQAPLPSTSFGQYFDDLNGNEKDLPEY